MRSDPVPTDDSCAVQNTAAKSEIETLIVILLRTQSLCGEKRRAQKKASPVPSLKT